MVLLMLIGLTACVVQTPADVRTTYVAPAPTTTYVAPAAPSTATVSVAVMAVRYSHASELCNGTGCRLFEFDDFRVFRDSEGALAIAPRGQAVDRQVKARRLVQWAGEDGDLERTSATVESAAKAARDRLPGG